MQLVRSVLRATRSIPSSARRRASSNTENGLPPTPLATAGINLIGIPFSRLSDITLSLGEPKFRAKQLWRALYAQAATATPSIDGFTTLSKKTRAALGAQFQLDCGHIISELISVDGTRKWIVQLPGSAQQVECVYIPSSHKKGYPGGLAEAADSRAIDVGDDEDDSGSESSSLPNMPADRRLAGTLCVSSQVGCSLACTFCFTGTQRLEGNVESAGIVAQFLLARRRLAESAAFGERRVITRVVFMGQGEPLYNWRSVRNAIAVLTHPEPGGIGLAPHRITVSTAGVAPSIARVADEAPGVRLAVSLHAPSADLRAKIMGIERSFPTSALMESCQNFLLRRLQRLRDATLDTAVSISHEDSEVADLTKSILGVSCRERFHALERGLRAVADRHNGAGRCRISFEYVLLRGVNDSPSHAAQLRAMLSEYLPLAACHVNLLSFHPWPGAPYEPVSPAVMLNFQRVVQHGDGTLPLATQAQDRGGGREHGRRRDYGLPLLRCTIRHSRGVDILGACGQLKSSGLSKMMKS